MIVCFTKLDTVSQCFCRVIRHTEKKQESFSCYELSCGGSFVDLGTVDIGSHSILQIWKLSFISSACYQLRIGVWMNQKCVISHYWDENYV